MPSLSNNVKVTVTTDANTSGIDETNQALGNLGKKGDETKGTFERMRGAMEPLIGIAAGAGVALYGMTNFISDSISKANDLNNSLLGLSSVASGFGQNVDKTKEAAKDLAKDGLMTVADSATSLKNLLASGFNLDEAVTLMNRFKDSAAFGRQASLGFGESIRGATEGIKNGNSILVDNAGVTKNLSMMLTDAGFSAQDLMKASSDAGVRQAIFNGIIKETRTQVGNAAELTGTFAGKQAMLSSQTTILKQNIGNALQTALLPMMQAITPIVTKIADWISHHQKLAAGIAIGIVVFLALIAIVGLIAAAIMAVMAVIAAFGAGVVIVAVIIVAAMAAAIAFLIIRWTDVKNFISGIPIALANAFMWLGGALAGIWDGIRNVVMSYVRWLVDGIVDLFVKLPQRIVGAVGNIGASVANQFKGALHSLHIPGFATGVRNFTGGLAVVGEQGPELVNLPSGSDVYTNGESKSMMGSGGGSGGNNTFIIQNLSLPDVTDRQSFINSLNADAILASKGLAVRAGA